MLSSGSWAKLSLEAGAARGLTIGSAPGETYRWNKHVVIHGCFAEDVGSTPTASIPRMASAMLVMASHTRNDPEERSDEGPFELHGHGSLVHVHTGMC